LIEKIEREFKQHLRMIEAEEKLAVYKELSVVFMKKSEVYGGTRPDYDIEYYPTEEELCAKSEETLRQLRIKKVEWNSYNDFILSIRFTLSDDTVLEQSGYEDVEDSFEFPEDRPIQTIKVRAIDDDCVC